MSHDEDWNKSDYKVLRNDRFNYIDQNNPKQPLLEIGYTINSLEAENSKKAIKSLRASFCTVGSPQIIPPLQNINLLVRHEFNVFERMSAFFHHHELDKTHKGKTKNIQLTLEFKDIQTADKIAAAINAQKYSSKVLKLNRNQNMLEVQIFNPKKTQQNVIAFVFEKIRSYINDDIFTLLSNYTNTFNLNNTQEATNQQQLRR